MGRKKVKGLGEITLKQEKSEAKGMKRRLK